MTARMSDMGLAGLLSQPGFREELKTAADRRDDVDVILHD